MKKLLSLRQHLMTSGLNIQPDNLLVFAERGTVESYRGEQNAHFALNYQGTIIITEYAGTLETISYVILQWLDKNQYDYKPEAIRFDADILNHHAVDLSLTLELSEIIKVNPSHDGTYLNHCAEPNLTETINLQNTQQETHG